MGDNIVTRQSTCRGTPAPRCWTPWASSKRICSIRSVPRFPVQDVYKFDARRISPDASPPAVIRVGDRFVFSPSNKTANIESIEAFNVEPPPSEARAGQSIGVTLDEQIFVERGEIATDEESSPAGLDRPSAPISFWLGRRPLERREKVLNSLGDQGGRV